MCAKCDLEHVDPKPTTAELRELYASKEYFRGGTRGQGYQDYEAERRSIRLTAAARLKRLERIGFGERLLEIGPGLGYFLDVAAEKGLEVSGLEVSDFARDRLRERHHTLSGNLWEHDLEDAYDVVVMFDTLEHIIYIRRLKRSLLRVLRPGGVFAFTTPDNRSLTCRVLGTSWWSYRFPEHVAFFNRRSVRNWLGEEFELVESSMDWQFMELGRAAQRIGNLRAGAGKAVGFVIRKLGLERWNVPLPNSNRFFIARRA